LFSGVPVGNTQQWPGVRCFQVYLLATPTHQWPGVTCFQVCLLATPSGQVWAGSHDSAIYVVDNSRTDLITCTDTLFAHTDKVVAMTAIARNRLYSPFVLSARK